MGSRAAMALLDAGDSFEHALHEVRIVKLGAVRMEECVGGVRVSDAAGYEELSEHGRDVCGLREGRGFLRMRGSNDPTLRGPGGDHGLLVLVVVRVGVVDDDVLEAFDVFEQRLVALVPLGGGFVQKDEP
jgi:hypothetical protein